MPDSVGYKSGDFTFETVHDEAGSQLIFEEVGDEYIGEFLGIDTIEFVNKDTGESDSFLQIRFRDPEGPKALNAGYELAKYFTETPPQRGVIIRLLLANKVDMGKGKNPMLSFRIDVASPKNARSKQS